MDEAMTNTATTRRARSGAIVRTIRAVGWASLVAGLLILGFVVQQLFVTSWFAERNQAQLEDEAQSYFEIAAAESQVVPYVPPASGEEPDPGTTPIDPTDPSLPTIVVEPKPPAHQAFAIIRIPDIPDLVDGWTVVEGVTRSDLRNGAGHMVHTPLPGQPGNSVISGHRTTYGAPFHNLDTLDPGAFIEVETAIGVHTYAVRETVIVRPNELWVTEPRDGAWLTLTTCHPKFSSRERLVVVAELVDGPNAPAMAAAAILRS